MHNQEQHPIFGHPDCCISILLVDACIFDVNKSIEENLTCHFKLHAMLADVAGRLLRVPHKALAEVQEVEIHHSDVYTLYIPLSSDSCCVSSAEFRQDGSS